MNTKTPSRIRGASELLGFTKLASTWVDLCRRSPRFLREFMRYNQLAPFSARAKISNLYPRLGDKSQDAGTFDFHYFYQDLWAARQLFLLKPREHLDIGSRIDGFVAHVLVFMPVTVMDIRPLPITVTGLSFIHEDVAQLSKFRDDSVPSISSLHVAEHIGLGRYGDAINPDGHIEFMEELIRVLEPGGSLLFSVPTGKEVVYFNAHRVLAPSTVLNIFSKLALTSFSVVDDSKKFHDQVEPMKYSDQLYACGMYRFTKPLQK